MNGINKATVGVVFGIALLYGAASLVLSVSGTMDTGSATLRLLAPHDGEMYYDLSDGLGGVVDAYRDFIELFGDGDTIAVVLEVLGFVLAVAGMATGWSLGVKGTDNPAQYLWTHRPNAVARGILAPFGLIPACYERAKPLVIVPVVLLPFYVVWAVLLTLALIIPFLVMRLIIGSRIRSAAKKEREAPEDRHAVCPKCKRDFDMPKVKCTCGLILDYPLPNRYGFKVHTCNNGHDMPCVKGKRGDLRTVCPYCGEDIETREARPVTFALVGAQGAGKTTLMLSAVSEITKVARSRSIGTDAATPGISKDMVAAKESVARTAQGELDSECLFIRSTGLDDRELVFNDISGAEFEPREGKAIFEEYYRYCDGIVFVIDSNALVRGRGQTPMEVFDSFYSIYTRVLGIGPGAVSKTPLAIVASKTDILESPVQSSDVRALLLDNGQEQFVKVVEGVFSDIRYFAASSTGDDGRSAAAPFWWIVAKTDKELADKVPVLSQ